ncbi:MAG TPA: rod shape-determining protein MreD [Candidatus Baltobacteraceae bacterium]
MAGVYLALALLAQVELLHFARFRGAEVSLVLVVVVWYAIRVDARRAAVYGLIAGLCEDVLATQTGAAWTISTTITAILAGMLSRGFFADSTPLVAGITFIATLIRSLFFWIVMAIEGYPAGYAAIHFHQALWQALLNAALVVVLTLAIRYRENLPFR